MVADVKASDVLAHYERMSEADRALLAHALERIQTRPVTFTVDSLEQLKSEELKAILDVQEGIRLTREHVPDLRRAYEELKGKELSSKVCFGRIERPPNG